MSDCEEQEQAEALAEEPTRRAPRQHGRTQSIKRLSKRALEAGRQEAVEALDGLKFTRPKTRDDCLQGENAQRPCPFLSCKHHLALDVNPKNGAVKVNFPDANGEVNWDAMPESCALDVADRGGVTLEEVGVIMNLTRERIRQLETKGIAKIKALSEMAALMDYVD